MDEYLAALPDDSRATLERVRGMIAGHDRFHLAQAERALAAGGA